MIAGTVDIVASAAGDWIVGAATVLATVLAVFGSFRALAQMYRRTLGRRKHASERLARLGTGAQLSFFESVLGEPPAISQTVVMSNYRDVVTADDPRFELDLALKDCPECPSSHDVFEERCFLRSIFVDRDYFVQTITDDDATVVAFSVTTRNRKFAPTFEWPPGIGWRERREISKRWGERFSPLFHVQLGRTRFSDFGDEERDDFAGPRYRIAIGAHNYAYSEFQSFGNPGGYQSFVFTASDVAPGLFGDGLRVQEELGGNDWPADDQLGRSWSEMRAARAFRRNTVVTTYTAIGMTLWDENFPTSYAPPDTIVRTLP